MCLNELLHCENKNALRQNVAEKPHVHKYLFNNNVKLNSNCIFEPISRVLKNEKQFELWG